MGVVGHPYFVQEGGSATPMWPKATLTSFFLLFFFLKKKRQPHIAILVVSRVTGVKISQFWTEKWTEVLYLSFFILHVLLMKISKTEEIKNKSSKPHGV
jgi:hypothetical protein